MIATMPATSCLKGFKGGFRGLKGKSKALKGGNERSDEHVKCSNVVMVLCEQCPALSAESPFSLQCSGVCRRRSIPTLTLQVGDNRCVL